MLGTAVAAKPKMRYFKASEFGVWWPLMNHDTLLKLDAFRHQWGAPVIVSRANGGLGRRDESHSQHNILFTGGTVRAVDVFPMVPDGQGGYHYMNDAISRVRAMEIAKAVGFTGIGLYTDTMPGNMLHVDTRTDRAQGNPALWARVDNAYTGIGMVLS